MKRHPILFILLVLAASMLACSLGSGKPPQTENTALPENTSTAGSATPIPAEPYISAPGVSAITLLTAVNGAGAKPLFEWKPVTGAARYQLVVYDSTKTPYWAWEGTNSKIYLGGSDQQPPADSEGPVLEGEASWVVFAYDAQGQLIASSPVQMLNP